VTRPGVFRSPVTRGNRRAEQRAGLASDAGDLGGDVDEQFGLVVVAERGRQQVELFGGEAASVLQWSAAGVGDGAEEEPGGSAVGAVAEGVEGVEEDGFEGVDEAVSFGRVVRPCLHAVEGEEFAAASETPGADTDS
jgi:hypothetical protein